MLAEPFEQPGVLVGGVPDVVLDARVFLDFDLDAGLAHQLGPVAGNGDGDDFVIHAVVEVNGGIEGVAGVVFVEGGGDGAEGDDGGPDVGALEAEFEGAAAAHAESRQICAFFIHIEALFDVGEHGPDVGFGDAAVAHGAAGEGTGDEEGDGRQGREVAHRFGIGLAFAVALSEDAAEVDSMVGESAVEADDEGPGAGGVVAVGDVDRVRLIGVVEGRVEGEDLGSGGERLGGESGGERERRDESEPLHTLEGI